MREIKSKTGMASMFVVIFTTLLLSIISLGFVSIMISEANQTINFDLSQSAYDSALAGVEDAKIALLKYHECRSRGDTTSKQCVAALNITKEGSTKDCDLVKKMLMRPGEDGETLIQSDSGSAISENGESIEQAYTCVLISEDSSDYLGTLNPNYRSKVIPIRTANNIKIDRIKLEWYNSEDQNKVKSSASAVYTSMGSGGLKTNKEGYGYTYSSANNFGTNAITPSVIQYQLIQTAKSFKLAQFDENDGANTNRGTLLLNPSQNGTNLIQNSASIGLASSSDKSFNNTVNVKCNTGSENYACATDIVVPSPIGGARNDGTMFVRLVLPYGEPDTSFSIKLYSCGTKNTTTNPDADCELIDFVGVQAKIDSTGRANDLFRRVEARVEMVDIYYPFPEFAADVSGEGASSIWKNYWVTRNCWFTGPGNKGTKCNDYGSLGN